MKGTLQVKGSLSLAQFWPAGQSDADTAKLLIEVGESAFTFRANPKAEAKPTHIFDDAVVHGRITRPVLQKGKLTVRLQGLDASELHFTPQAMVPVGQQEPELHQRFLRWNYAFRQPIAEQSTLALRELLAGAKQEKLACRIETKLDDPAEAEHFAGILYDQRYPDPVERSLHRPDLAVFEATGRKLFILTPVAVYKVDRRDPHGVSRRALDLELLRANPIAHVVRP